jgi:hypothetical protein
MITIRFGVIWAVLFSIALAAAPAGAQVSVNVRIGEPPPVVVVSPPTMVLLPEPQMYVAVGVPYDIYFLNGRYYYLHGGHWFWGPGYGGPWTYVAVEKLPPGLRKFKVKQLHEFRDREVRVYKTNGRYFVAEEREHPGKGHGKGKGKKH